MEYNNRPTVDESHDTGLCSEPAIGFTTAIGYSKQVMEPQGIFRDETDDGVGPYSIEEMNSRIDEAEVIIAKAEQGDTSGWVTAKQMDAELYSTFPWLR